MKKILLVSTIAAMLFAYNAFAENFTLGLGPIGNIFVVDATPQLGPGVGGHVYFDYRWSPQISTTFSVVVTNEDGEGGNSGDNNIVFLGIPTIDFKYYLLSSESHWDPYLLLGVGIYTLMPGSKSNSTTGVGFGAQAGLGCDYYFTEKWSVGVSAMFRSIGLITGVDGSNNGTAIFPFSMLGMIGYHF